MRKEWSVTLPVLFAGDRKAEVLTALSKLGFREANSSTPSALIVSGLKTQLLATVPELTEQSDLNEVHDIVTVVDFNDQTEGYTALVVAIASEFYPTECMRKRLLTAARDLVAAVNTQVLRSSSTATAALEEPPLDMVRDGQPRCPITRIAKSAIITAAQTCRKSFG